MHGHTMHGHTMHGHTMHGHTNFKSVSLFIYISGSQYIP
jgi:hypothetical protein